MQSLCVKSRYAKIDSFSIFLIVSSSIILGYFKSSMTTSEVRTKEKKVCA